MAHTAQSVHRRALVLLSALVLLPVMACSDDASDSGGNRPQGELPPIELTLRVGVTESAGSVRRAIYDQSGVFDDAPYRFDLVEFEGTNAALEALNAGAIDVAALMMGTSVVLAQGNAATEWTAETAPFVVVDASVPIDDPGFQLLVGGDSDIETVEDLVGRQVAFSPGAIGHYFLVRVASEAGLTRGDIVEVPLTPPEGRAAFISGAVDGLIAGYRNSLPLVASGEARVLAASGDYIEIHTLTLVRAGLLEDDAYDSAIGDLLERLEAAHVWSVANVDALAQIYETEAGFPPDEARVAAIADPKRRVPLDAAVAAALQDQASVFFSEGVIATEPEVSTLFDRRFG
jgi:sulfonate transport system substrate-binding protein